MVSLRRLNVSLVIRNNTFNYLRSTPQLITHIFMFFHGNETYILLVSTPNEAAFVLIVQCNKLCYNVFTKYLYKEVVIMASTQPVNFRADSTFYQQSKEILADEKITLSDVFNAALRKIATGAVDPKEFVFSDSQETQYQVAFEDLKKEILLGHQDIQQGKLTSLSDVRKEFGLD